MSRHPRSARRAATFAVAALAIAAGAAHAQVATTCPTDLATTQLFSYTGAPATFQVPANVNAVRAIVIGADGGQAANGGFNGGAGARAEGTYAVTPGQQFTVLVGQSGRNGDFESGGGGASGVWFNAGLALIAGGGGGGDNTGNGGGGQSGTAGGNGGNPATNTCQAGGLGGTGGAGGQFGELAPPTNCQDGSGGGGGGGLNSAGGSSAIQNPGTGRRGPTGGAQCAIGGAAGGQPGQEAGGTGGGVAGGFGACGGGGADDRESGGGGGYSGGGGGPESAFPGGGGSFVSGTATSTVLTAGTSGGGSARNGTVRLCYSTQADLRITKSNTAAAVDPSDDTVVSGATTVYSLVVTNVGPANANGAVIRDTPTAGLTCNTATCGSATGGAVCPAALTPGALATTGVAIPTLPVGGALTISLSCTVQ